MPGADKTTEAKEGVLTYMRAWGGTFLSSCSSTKHAPTNTPTHRVLSTSHRTRNPHHSPTLPPFAKAAYALRPRPPLLFIPEPERFPR
jgi:hypothetical protein